MNVSNFVETNKIKSRGPGQAENELRFDKRNNKYKRGISEPY